MNWTQVFNLALPLVSYLVAFFVHKPSKVDKQIVKDVKDGVR